MNWVEPTRQYQASNIFIPTFFIIPLLKRKYHALIYIITRVWNANLLNWITKAPILEAI